VAAGTVTIFSDVQPSGQSFALVLPPLAKSSPGPIHVSDIIRFDRTRLNFPPEVIGSQTDPAVVHVVNAGLDAGNIENVTPFGAALAASDCGTLLPGQGCTVKTWVSSSPVNSGMAVLYDNQTRQDFFLQVTPSSTVLLASASALEFGTQFAGGAAIPRVLTVTNTSAGQVTPAVSMQGDSAFQITNSTCGSLAPHQSCEVEVSFLPQLSANYNGAVVISSGSDSTQTSLHGSSAVNSLVTANPLWIDLQSVVAGLPATAPTPNPEYNTIVLTNTASFAISVTGITFSSSEFSEVDTCQSAVQPGSTCSVTVGFAPQTLGPKNASMNIQFSGGAHSQLISVSGTGVTPLGLSPSALDFGYGNAIGVTSAGQGITLGNGGPTPGIPYILALDGDFQIVQNPCPPSPMPAFRGCVLVVAFKPTKSGPQTGHLTVAFPGNSVTAVVTLTGSTDPGPSFLAPASVDFGTSAPGMEVHRSLSITNGGSVDLLIPSYSIIGGSGDSFNVGTGQCAVIHPGGICALTLGFLPSSAGSQQTSLVIHDNAPGNPHTISLTGTAASSPAFVLSATGASDVVVKSGAAGTFNLSAASINGFAGTVQFTCSGGPANSACTVQPSSITLAANGSTPITLSIQTQKTASLTPLPWTGFVAFAACIVIGTIPRRNRKWFSAKRGWIISVCLLACVLSVACGGGGSASNTPTLVPTPTPAPTPAPTPVLPTTSYGITVTATSATQMYSLHLTMGVQ
jgi:hypothetical protein